jgi:hypothetical protein
MDAELRIHLEGMEQRLRDSIHESEARSKSHTETVETRLLNEFWKWGRTTDASYCQNSGVVAGLDVRVGVLEDRVAELERGDSAEPGRAS